ncbi:hypothetical protein [Desulfovibrio sp. JC010]|uniref:hypothetical protein n=1 Tax=Desulfovibrio sp. JC010 TaxID=2593641 RepID=UPI0013D0AC70|nr:hypothetical protein [Desulfovibrio sp. JC010]NDV26034.1 hypothetical protein [Desulfovibrio sp. JC010]
MKKICIATLLLGIVSLSGPVQAGAAVDVQAVQSELGSLRALLQQLEGERADLLRALNAIENPVSEQLVKDKAPQDIAGLPAEQKLEAGAAYKQKVLIEDEGGKERKEVLEDIASFEEVYSGPENWDIRDGLDKERLNLANQLNSPDDVKALKDKVSGEVGGLKDEIEQAKAEGNEFKANVLQGQLEVKEQVIDELELTRKKKEFENKPPEEQSVELDELRDGEREIHQQLVQANGRLQELEKEVAEADNAWLGLGSPSQEQLDELKKQRGIAAGLEKEFAETQKEMLVKAGTVGPDSSPEAREAADDVFEHASKRAVAQLLTVQGQEQSLGVEEEQRNQDTAKAAFDAAMTGDFSKSVALAAKGNMENEVGKQGLGRNEEKLQAMTEALKRGADERQQTLDAKTQQVKQDFASGKIDGEQAAAALQDVADQSRNNEAVKATADLIEKNRVGSNRIEETKGVFTQTEATWNEETHGSKTGVLYKSYNLVSSIMGDAAGVVVDKYSDVTGGAGATSSTTRANQQKEQANDNTMASIRSVQAYKNLSGQGKEELLQHELYGKPLSKESKKVYDQLDKNYFSQQGGKSLDLISAGPPPASPRDKTALALAKAERDLKNDIKDTKTILTTEHDMMLGLETQRLSVNPATWASRALTSHEKDKAMRLLADKKKELNRIEYLREDYKAGLEDKGDMKRFMRTNDHGLELAAQLEKDNAKKKIAAIDAELATGNLKNRDELWKKRQEISATSGKRVASYLDQSAHLKAENQVAKGNYEAANAIYEEQAQRNPQKASLYKGLIKTNREYQVDRKVNEMSASLVQQVGTDAVMYLATGGAGKGATTGQKLKAAGSAFNPASGVNGILSNAQSQVMTEVIVQKTGMDRKTVSEMMMLGGMAKKKAIGAEKAYRTASNKAKASFDTAWTPAVDKRSKGFVERLQKNAQQQKGKRAMADKEVAARATRKLNQKSQDRVETSGRDANDLPHIRALRNSISGGTNPRADKQTVLDMQRDTRQMRDLKGLKGPDAKRLQDAFNKTLHEEIYNPMYRQTRKFIQKQPGFKDMEIVAVSKRTPGAKNSAINTDNDINFVARNKKTGEQMEVPKELYRKVISRSFSELSEVPKPSNWKVMSAAEKQRFYDSNFERHGQKAMDGYDPEACDDYRSYKLDKKGQRVKVTPRAEQVKKMLDPDELRKWKQQNPGGDNKVLLNNPGQMGEMYFFKPNEELNRGNRSEALAQASKGASMLLAVRESYRLQGVKNLHKLDPKFMQVVQLMKKQTGDSSSDPRQVEAEVRRLGFRNLEDAFYRLEAEFGALGDAR